MSLTFLNQILVALCLFSPNNFLNRLKYFYNFFRLSAALWLVDVPHNLDNRGNNQQEVAVKSGGKQI
jgi:hypothetical protein